MGLSENYFWENTPKKILTLIEQRREIDKANAQALAVYIGCVFSGKNFDGLEDKKIEGIDVPVSEATLRGFF